MDGKEQLGQEVEGTAITPIMLGGNGVFLFQTLDGKKESRGQKKYQVRTAAERSLWPKLGILLRKKQELVSRQKAKS